MLSNQGLGIILIHFVHAITFFSKKLSPTMQEKSMHVRELFVIIKTIGKS